MLTNSSGNIIPFCIWYRTKQAIAEHERQYTPSHVRLLRFYDKSKKLRFTSYSDKLMYHNDCYNKLFQTEMEFIIGIKNHLDKFNKYSFIEIFDGEVFKFRMFVRHGKLTQYASEEPDRELCPFIKKELVKDRPVFNWRRIMADTMFPGKSDPRKLSMWEFYNKYKNV